MKPVLQRLRFRRFSTVELLIALGLLFVSLPFVEEIKGGDLILSVLLSLVMLSAVVAVASRRGAFIVALLLLIPAIAGRWINPPAIPPPGAAAPHAATRL